MINAPRARLASSLALLALAPVFVSAQTATRVELAGPSPARTTEIESPFHRLTPAGASARESRDFATISFDETAFEVLRDLHDRSQLMRLTGFPMPGNLTIDLDLRPVEGMAPGAKAIVMNQGGQYELAPSVRLFTGYVRGRTSRVFIGISREMLHGYFSLDGELFFLSSGSDVENRGSNQAIVSRADMYPAGAVDSFCHVGELEVERAQAPPIARSFGSPVRDTTPFVELDNDYRAKFASDQAAIDYAVLLTAAMSEVYRRDLSVTVSLPNNYVRLWNVTPPWGEVTTFGHVSNLALWWTTAAPNKSIRRSVVHLLTNPVFGGVAQGINLTCSHNSSYAISSVNGSFPYPIQHQSGSNWDLFVYAHENGHIYGSGHTFAYSPPIECLDGSGPDQGTIMSYCHQQYGTGGVGMRFHLRVQDAIRQVIKNAPCRVVTQLTAGDYDGNGAVDAADLMEFDAYVLQGFDSRGCEDVFDLNVDGVVDGVDRTVMLTLQTGPIPPASWVWLPGSGVNPINTYQGISNPVLGGIWSSAVTGFGGSRNTIVFGSIDPLVPGVITPYGELLVAISGFGGQTLFTHFATTSFSIAIHDIPLPYDVALIGLKAYVQGGIFKPSGLELGYAIELTLSIFE